VWHEQDAKLFTHIIYLDVSPALIAQFQAADEQRHRRLRPFDQLTVWQDFEKKELAQKCYANGILLVHVKHAELFTKIEQVITDFRTHNFDHNLNLAKKKMTDIMIGLNMNGLKSVETMVVFDGDKTLDAADTGEMFWRASTKSTAFNKLVLSTLYRNKYRVFRQAVMLYDGYYGEAEFENKCKEIAEKIPLYPQFKALLQQLEHHRHVGAVVITCGLQRIWELIMERHDLKHVKIIGAGRIADGLAVTPYVKGALVQHLQDVHKCSVFAFGDGPLDLEMLRMSDRAMIVTGEEVYRSRTMNEYLRAAVEEGFRGRQVVVSPGAPPHPDVSIFPLSGFDNWTILHEIVGRSPKKVPLYDATEKAASCLLSTLMRNAAIEGPTLRAIHGRVGLYLGTEYIGEILGLEQYSIPHVQGKSTTGWRLKNVKKTTIIALMRGGEPMALGINDAFPLTTLLHAKHTEDVRKEHVQDEGAVIMVDSVINTGKTILEFVHRVRKLNSSIPIVIVTGVVQAESLEVSLKLLGYYDQISVVTLRVSENKYTGRGATDTGARLFNTIEIEKAMIAEGLRDTKLI
jgi:uracil phosphoribosyltransferase/phosphoserine phosphatase